METPAAEWKRVCGRADFDATKSEKTFCELVALARVVNALLFVQAPLLTATGETPHDRRQRINSFLFTCALLFEGMHVARRLERHFGELASFKSGFAKILNNPSFEMLRRSKLRYLRNKSVFHFDSSQVRSALTKLPDDDEQVFVCGSGPREGDVHYELADWVVLAGTLDRADETIFDQFEGVVKIATELSVEYSRSANHLIAEALERTGKWKHRES